MSGPKPIKKTRAVELWDAGERDYNKIAEAIGSTYKATRSMIYRAGRKKGYWPLHPHRTGRPENLSLVAPEGLWEESRRRNMSPRQLAQQLLRLIDEEKLYHAVLD